MCSFALLCIHTIRSLRLHENIASSTEPFVVPGLPHRMEVTRSQLPTSLSIISPDLKVIYQKLREVEVAAGGVLINSFAELETGYAKCFEEAIGTKAWLLGPLSLVNKNAWDKVVYQGKGASASASECLNWLDLKPPKSVVYVSFGSMCRLTPSQLMEIGLGLEASNQPFIWVVRKNERSTEIEKWLEGGFEERLKERGLAIKGWAPQIMILSHPATGGFLTRCGWNSTLESICADLPMITWPHSAEQFLNEKLLQVLEIAISINIKTASRLWQDSCTEEMVKMEDVKKAVETLMDGGREAEERRKRAKELGEKSRKAMELGGSSCASLTHMIQYVACKAQNNKPVAQEL